MDSKRRILFRQLLQRDTHLVLVHLGLRLDSDRNNRLRKFHSLKRYDLLDVTQRVTRGDVLQPDSRRNIAGANFLDLFAIIRVHLQYPANTLFLVLDRVKNRVARVKYARVNPEKRQIADERVRRNLECQRRERIAVSQS